MKPSATTLTVETLGATAARQRQPLGEDWLAVWIGGLSIAIVLAGARPALPAFVWARAADLTDTVFGPQNLTSMLIAGALAGILGSAGVLLMKESCARFMIGFPVLYVLACA